MSQIKVLPVYTQLVISLKKKNHNQCISNIIRRNKLILSGHVTKCSEDIATIRRRREFLDLVLLSLITFKSQVILEFCLNSC